MKTTSGPRPTVKIPTPKRVNNDLIQANELSGVANGIQDNMLLHMFIPAIKENGINKAYYLCKFNNIDSVHLYMESGMPGLRVVDFSNIM